MESSKYIFGLVLCTFLFVTGCETVKGLKQDTKNTWHNIVNIKDNMMDLDKKTRDALW